MNEIPTQNIYATVEFDNEAMPGNLNLFTFSATKILIMESMDNGQKVLESVPVLFVGLWFTAN